MAAGSRVVAPLPEPRPVAAAVPTTVIPVTTAPPQEAPAAPAAPAPQAAVSPEPGRTAAVETPEAAPPPPPAPEATPEATPEAAPEPAPEAAAEAKPAEAPPPEAKPPEPAPPPEEARAEPPAPEAGAAEEAPSAPKEAETPAPDISAPETSEPGAPSPEMRAPETPAAEAAVPEAAPPPESAKPERKALPPAKKGPLAAPNEVAEQMKEATEAEAAKTEGEAAREKGAESEIAQLPAPVKPPEARPPEKKAPEAKPPAAPDPALLERGREGMLPTIGPHGRQPWQVYARPFDMNDKRPRIAVVVSDLGLSGAATEAAIQQLPGSVTLAFSPYAQGLEQWARLARTAGHEVFLNLPMEPVDYPDQDPGPYALLTSIDPKQNLFRMDWLLSRATGYAGVTNHMGSRFTTSTQDLRPILEVLKARGLMFLDSRSSDQSVAARMASEMKVPVAYNNRFIDAVASRDAIDRNLADIEKIARRTGYAVAIGSAYPVTIERLSLWLPKVEEQGFAIAPVTAIADKQDLK
jgi:polysaccharide deacetylase 2 family uncharacterized protein YibQ